MLNKLRCLFFGHDDHLTSSKGRVFLRCQDCQRETAGWSYCFSQPARSQVVGE